jgi:hypothetical protein
VNLIYLEYGILRIPIAIIIIPEVGKSTLQKPSLKQNERTRLCLSIPIISTRGISKGISKNALAVPLPMKNSKIIISAKIISIETSGEKSCTKLYI